MAAFHLCYDLKFIYNVTLNWFEPPLQDIWRSSISWVFLLVAGCMCSYSRNGAKRAMRYLLVALSIRVVTTLAAIDTPIRYGIIFCMGASTLIEYMLSELHLSPRGVFASCLLFAAFLLLRNVPTGTIGFGPLALSVPHQLYQSPWLSFLGFPGPGFVSGDYYPIIPFTLMYVCGVSLGHAMQDNGIPRWLSGLSCAPLAWVGRQALPIYVLHQPVIILVLELLGLG